ncbi:uncharacterized protein sytl2b isoform X2 [Stigmatopora nigra]
MLVFPNLSPTVGGRGGLRGRMIDLSHLTEEERCIIMTVLRRDAHLKEAEEQRIRKLESVFSQVPPSDSKLKYLTGQWFYEAKSRRHMDKIHGSEIILASMKHRRTSDGSFRGERPRAPSSPSSDVEVPHKPARSFDTPLGKNPVQKQDLKSAVHSPRMMRLNPFNRASLTGVELSEECFETDPTFPTNQKTGPISQTSGDSITSEGSPMTLRPIPRKRTFLPIRTPSQSDSSSTACDPRVAPAPRPSLHQGSSGSSQRSKTEVTVLSHPNASADIPLGPPCDGSPVISRSSPDGRKTSVTAETATAPTAKDNPTMGKHPMTERIIKHDSVIGSSVVSSLKEPEWQRTGAEPPISYDIKFIESSDQKKQKRSQKKHSYKLTSPASSPTSNDEDSILKVLDWFNRSTDNIDLLEEKDRSEVSTDAHRHCETNVLEGEEIKIKDVATIEKKEPSDLMAGESEGGSKKVMGNAKNYEQKSKNISLIESFWEKGIQYKTITSGAKPETKGGDEKKPIGNSGVFNGKVTYVANGVDGNQDSGMKHNQDSLYSKNNITSPQKVERKGSSDNLLSVEQQAPNPSLQTYPELKISSLDQPDTRDLSVASPSPNSGKICVAQSSQFGDCKTCENHADIICKTLGTSIEVQSPKRKDTDSSHSQRQNLSRQDNTAEKIKQLKNFWEQETSKMWFNGIKPKANRGSILNKRFTKSEFDLRNIGNNSDSDGEDAHRNLNDLPPNQKIDKISPTLSSSRAQFNSLLGFWDDTTTDSKPKSPKRQVNSPQPPQHSAEPEARSLSPVEKALSRQIVSPSKATNDTQNKLSELGPYKEPQKILKDSNMDDKAARPPSTPSKGIRSPRRKKENFSQLSGGGKSMRRATSMLALVNPEEAKLNIHVSPVHSQSRKQSIDHNQNIRRGSEGTETPLARAFVPRDYSHYLGMADKQGTPASGEEAGGGGGGFGTPERTSTPTGSEDRSFKRNTKMSPRHVWTNNSADAEPESPIHSTSEPWPKTRNFLNWKANDEEESPVRKALRRAEARPKGLAKSMEDLTGSSSPRQERRKEQKTEMRRPSDVGPLTAPSSPSFSDQDHLKKISKSVPLFMQKEDDNHIYEDIFHHGIQMMDSSSISDSVSSLSGSVLTMYSGDLGSVEVQGSIQFSINYVQKLKEFHIFVAQCRDLAAVDPKRGRSDPYVKSYLVPDKIHLGKKKTSVKKKTLNPTFNEILRYRVGIDYLRTQTLILSVWHHDTFGRNNFLGEVDMDLSKWNFDHTHMNDLALRARTTLAHSTGRGEMRLALRFLPKAVPTEVKEAPTTGEIHIWVKECKSLPLIRATIDPYVKCFVLPDTSRRSRQKTRVLRRTTEPVFNHTMVYDGIREIDLAEACVELTVWDRDKLASNLLGGLRIGAGTGKSYGSPVDWMDSTADEVALWNQMVGNPNEWAESTLPLRMLSSVKTASK